MEPALKRTIVEIQRDELTEHHVYARLAGREKDAGNREVLERIGADELRHYEFWRGHTGEAPPVRRGKLWWYIMLARLLGLTFAVKLMEKGEAGAQDSYGVLAGSFPEAADLARDEGEHEDRLLEMIDEERLRYMGSVVLGLSDALVELTGALAGLTLALRNNRLIALIGLITGIAAALSMAASEYLSTKSEQGHAKSPLKACAYTGVAYVVTVAVLIVPYLVQPSCAAAVVLMLAAGLLIILAFSFYISVARGLSFTRRFAEMAGLSLGVAAVSFGIGYLLRLFMGVDV